MHTTPTSLPKGWSSEEILKPNPPPQIATVRFPLKRFRTKYVYRWSEQDPRQILSGPGENLCLSLSFRVLVSYSDPKRFYSGILANKPQGRELLLRRAVGRRWDGFWGAIRECAADCERFECCGGGEGRVREYILGLKEKIQRLNRSFEVGCFLGGIIQGFGPCLCDEDLLVRFMLVMSY